MDNTVYKVALAGFLHDVGKFAERAEGKIEGGSDKLNVGFFPNPEFVNNHRQMCQPEYNGQFSHKHAVYTAAFINHLEGVLPHEFNAAEWGLADSFMNLAACHHKPTTPMQWIITEADRLASGIDRESYEKRNHAADVANYRVTRMLCPFEEIDLPEKEEQRRKYKSADDFKWRMKLQAMSATSLFPVSRQQAENKDTAHREYSELFFEFAAALEKLEHRDCLHLWYEHFDSLYGVYTGLIPAATVDVLADVSLYDHSRAVAAFSAAAYQYHQARNSLTVEAVRNKDEKKYRLIMGDFFGIQSFIFSEGGHTRRNAAKLLRGRSFYVSMLSELAADLMLRELGLPVTSLLINAAGKFVILAPNLENTNQAIARVRKQINDWLVQHFMGQASFGIVSIEAAPGDFENGGWSELWKRLSRELSLVKSARIDLETYGGVQAGFIEQFGDHGLCPFCGRRPGSAWARMTGGDEKVACCGICADQMDIGMRLVQKDVRSLAITEVDADLHKDRLHVPIFGRYQISFKVGGRLGDLIKAGTLLRYWDISHHDDGSISRKLTSRPLKGYMPLATDADQTEEFWMIGGESDDAKLEAAPETGTPKCFKAIAKSCYSLVSGDAKGVEALGVLKADVDQLGAIMGFGLSPKMQTVARTVTLSRFLNHFFTAYLPYVFRQAAAGNAVDGASTAFRDIYTVFAGGDDLFLIGPWNHMITFADFLHRRFKAYVGENGNLHLSAGISIHHDQEPVTEMAESAEEALEKSKKGDGEEPGKNRNRITIFGETATWEGFAKLQEIRAQIGEWVKPQGDRKEPVVNRAMLYRFNQVLQLAEHFKKLNQQTSIDFKNQEDIESIKWPAILKYSIVRNVKDKKKHDEVLKFAEWVGGTKQGSGYGSAVRMALWPVIYENRRARR